MPKLVETILVISVLGTEPYSGDLSDLSEDVMSGDFSGHTIRETSRVIESREEQERVCEEHATDIGFFGTEFDAEGED